MQNAWSAYEVPDYTSSFDELYKLECMITVRDYHTWLDCLAEIAEYDAPTVDLILVPPEVRAQALALFYSRCPKRL